MTNKQAEALSWLAGLIAVLVCWIPDCRRANDYRRLAQCVHDSPPENMVHCRKYAGKGNP